MKISISSRGQATLILSQGDLERFGFTASAFAEQTPQAGLFISAIAAFLNELGLIDTSKNGFICTTSLVCGGVMVEIGTQEQSEETTLSMLLFEDPSRLCDLCLKLSQATLSDIIESELFRTNSGYALVLITKGTKEQLLSKHAFGDAVFDMTAIQKTREYGESLSRTPIQTIRKLRSL